MLTLTVEQAIGQTYDLHSPEQGVAAKLQPTRRQLVFDVFGWGIGSVGGVAGFG